MTEDAEAQSQFLRLHGFVVMGNILKEYASDMAIITLVRDGTVLSGAVADEWLAGA